GDETCTIRGEKRHDRRQLRGVSGASQRDQLPPLGQHLINGQVPTARPAGGQGQCTVRVEVARENRVDEHVVPCAVGGERFRESGQAGACGVRENEGGDWLLGSRGGE